MINPIAGMGGSVGLKGTDGGAYLEALKRGAKPVAPRRALEFLNSVEARNFELYTAPGIMGYDVAVNSRSRENIAGVVGKIKEPTTREDTVNIAREMSQIVELIVFVGGDGTAGDIYEAIGASIPVIGVPSGVKMYSAVFALNPRSAAKLLEMYLKGLTKLVEREVVDADEDSIRRDVISLRLRGYLLVPVYEGYVQESKSVYSSQDEEDNKQAIARYIVENMEPGIPYILGPGTTVKAICKALGLQCTVLGVDVILDKMLLVRDAWERDLLEVLDRFNRAKVIVTPIGKQGFIFGRGNQQISSRVLSRLSRDDIIVVATRSKAGEIKYLLVDTGDRALDEALSGYYKVLVDYNTYAVFRAISGVPAE